MSEQQVVLVNERDEMIDVMDKMEVHQKGLLHRAFSVFIFNTKGEMLLQQRALHKYHSGGLWTNACCSHPQPGEDTLTAAQRRLQEEIGFSTTLTKAFDFIYKAIVDNELTEHEFDHVFTGSYDGSITMNTDEVKDFAWQPMDQLKGSIESQPEKYTTWFRIAFPRVEQWWLENYKPLNKS